MPGSRCHRWARGHVLKFADGTQSFASLLEDNELRFFFHVLDPGEQIPFFSKQNAPSSTGFRRLLRVEAGLSLTGRGWTGRSETRDRCQLRLCRPVNTGRWSESVLALQQLESLTLRIQSEAAESQT